MLIKFLFALGLSLTAVTAQHVFPKYIPDNLKICYQDPALNNRIVRGPFSIDNLIALVRKVEQHNTCRTWSIDKMAGTLLRRFRYDGMVDSESATPAVPAVKKDPLENAKYSLIWSVIPVDISDFPEDALTPDEKCAMHWMLSYTVNRTRRAEETIGFLKSKVFVPRSNENQPAQEDPLIEEESSTEEEAPIQEETTEVNDSAEHDELHQNHHDHRDDNDLTEEQRRKRSLRVRRDIAISDSPLEMGVVQTRWGTVSAGSLLAGVFTAIKPQNLTIYDVIDEAERSNWNESILERPVDSRWVVTLAGDLGQSALIRGSKRASAIGPRGAWNHEVCNREYKLTTKDVSLLTTAEIYGGIDGLLIMNKVATWNEDHAKLSSVLEMYYSERGLAKARTVRACNRINLVKDYLAQRGNILQEQSTNAALVYYMKGMPDAPELSPSDAVNTVNDLVEETYNTLLSYLDNTTETVQDFVACSGAPVDSTTTEIPATYTDLTVVIDLFEEDPYIQQEKEAIALLASQMDIFSGGSKLEVVASDDGRALLSLDYSVNKAQLGCAVLNLTTPRSDRNFPKVLSTLRRSIFESRSDEFRRFKSGSNARVVLLIVGPQITVDENQSAMKSELELWKKDIPDVRLLFVTNGGSDPWRKYVVSPSNDIISFSNISDAVTRVMNRLVTLPARLTHPGCKSQNSSSMTTISEASYTYTAYLEPGTTQYFQIRPEHYFVSPAVTLKFTTLYGSSRVCLSRTRENPSFTDNCNLLDSTSYQASFTINQPCGPRGIFSQCQPIYVAMKAFDQIDGQPCSDPACRGPDQTRITFSHHGMLCNGATKLVVSYALGIALAFASLLINKL